MSIAGAVSRDFQSAEKDARRKSGGTPQQTPAAYRPAVVARFYDQAQRVVWGYELDGDQCILAQYWDGSIAVYYPDRLTRSVRVLQGHRADAARQYMRSIPKGGGVILDWTSETAGG